MLLVDTSVWSDHLRRHDAAMARLLEGRSVLVHPFVIGELACGVFPRRDETLLLLGRLPSAPQLGHSEVLGFIERHALAGRGIGFVDMHLLASALVAGAPLWTRDRRLADAASSLGIAPNPGP
jgi:predicted nucleic acid-binding protein